MATSAYCADFREMIKYYSKSAIMVFLLLALILTGSQVWGATGRIVYFVPHQDDGTLFMSADISRQYLSGKEIILVLITDGGASSVRQMICGQKNICMTKKQFSEARNREMVAATKRLAPRAVIKRENYPDGILTIAQASAVVEKYMRRYPDASFKTMSWISCHNDHRALGLALKNACGNNRLPNGQCIFFLKREFWDLYPTGGQFIDGYPTELVAADEYALWNPSIGRYAIGQHSVPQAFAALRHDPRNKFHLADFETDRLPHCLGE